MKNLVTIFSVIIFMSFTLSAQNVGTQAPNFTHNTLDHGQISLSDYQGKAIYLFFFAWG